MRLKLGVLFFILVTAVLVISSAFSYFSLRNELLDRYAERKQVIVKRLGDNLVRAMWNYDENQATDLVDAEMDSSDVDEINVYHQKSQAQELWFSRRKADSIAGSPDRDEVSVPLRAQGRELRDATATKEAKDLGSLQIYFTRKGFEHLLFDQLRQQFTGIVVLNLILALALYLVMSRMVVAPLARLSSAFRDLAKNPRAQGISMKCDDEFAEIVDAFNQIERRLLSDIEQRIEAEKKLRVANEDLVATQGQLLQSEKMAAIGQLAAGVAHEINNPIGFVNSNLGTLKKYIHQLLGVIDAYRQGDPESIKRACHEAEIDYLREDLPALLAESLEGLGRVAKIVQDLKEYSHVNDEGRHSADLNAALESTLNVVWHELKYKAEVVRELREIPLVECFPAQINQVFTNLLINAAQAIPERGKIFVRSRQEGESVVFEIEDTGIGMNDDVKRRIFNPFFTTKPVGKGTGLGLSISYDIIAKQHGGKLEVNSEPGQGACFKIVLPIIFNGQ